jgi:hypothetical protein
MIVCVEELLRCGSLNEGYAMVIDIAEEQCTLYTLASGRDCKDESSLFS